MTGAPAELTIRALRGIPEVRAGDDLAALLLTGVQHAGTTLAEGDLLVVSSKIASKAAGLTVAPADKADIVVAESDSVVAERQVTAADGVSAARVTRVVRAKAGPVMAAAGVDASNTGGRDMLLLLPRDPDAVCRDLRAALRAATGVRALGIVLSDTAGRAWRVGQTDFALGAAGVRVLDDLRGGLDADGRPLEVTARAIADEVAAAADLVKGKADGIPAVLVRGLGRFLTAGDAEAGADAESDHGAGSGARSLVRHGPGDWFALGAQEAVRAALGVDPGTALAQAVGIRPVGRDSLAAQVDRSVGVALATDLAGPAAVGVDVGEHRLEVTGDDPLVVGLIAARLSTALLGEGVPHEVAVDGGRVLLSLPPAAPAEPGQ